MISHGANRPHRGNQRRAILGATLSHVQTILSDITTALSAANASVSGGGSFGSVAAAETALHDSHVDILNVVNNDPTLAGLATQNGATGFMAVPATLPDGTTAASAPHANLAEIGAIFNDAANCILGGVNADNAGVITNDVNAVVTDMQALIQANPLLFGGLTVIDADTVICQLELENTYIGQAALSPDAGRASNDNILDIIDIVQGDTNLRHGDQAASPASALPRFCHPTPNTWIRCQTSFGRLHGASLARQQAEAAVAANDPHAISSLVTQCKTSNQRTNFDFARAHLRARFDTSCWADQPLGAECLPCQGIADRKCALVAAAADEMHANAADVSAQRPVTAHL